MNFLEIKIAPVMQSEINCAVLTPNGNIITTEEVVHGIWVMATGVYAIKTFIPFKLKKDA